MKDFVLSLLPELGTMGSKWGGVRVTGSSTSFNDRPTKSHAYEALSPDLHKNPRRTLCKPFARFMMTLPIRFLFQKPFVIADLKCC